MSEIHIFELRSEEINVKKILAVINATYAVAKRKPEKIRLAGIRTLTPAIPVQRTNQLSYRNKNSINHITYLLIRKYGCCSISQSINRLCFVD